LRERESASLRAESSVEAGGKKFLIMPRSRKLFVIAVLSVLGWAKASPAVASCWVCRGSGCWPAGENEYGKKLCFRPYGWCQLAGTLCAAGGGGNDGGIDEQDWLRPKASGLLPTTHCGPAPTSPLHGQAAPVQGTPSPGVDGTQPEAAAQSK